MISSRANIARSPILRLTYSNSPFLKNATRSIHPTRPNFSPKRTTSSVRYLSTSSARRQQEENEFFEPPLHLAKSKIARTEVAWKHPVFTGKEMEHIEIAHRPTNTFSDNVALSAVRFLRFCMDKATGYRHPLPSDGDDAKLAEKGKMTESKWLVRFIFLESVAGVPGMVGGMLRHLHSLRRMKRDNGWIESLLEEAFNERMHLLTFLKLYSPGLFMRTMILGAQGVFFNGFFLCYLISPGTCHRFVGYLEEEAVITYTCALADINAGKLPAWKNLEAPEIAIAYWNMPEGNRTMKDLLLYVRADEAKHREVNHTLGNLDQGMDPNPFVSAFVGDGKAHPSKGLEGAKPVGWTRDEAL